MNIDKHIDAVLAESAPTALVTSTDFKLWNICKYYRAVRPVLKIAKGLLFFKPKWQNVITLFMNVLDGVCPE